MNMPKFTAEASLYSSSKYQYKTEKSNSFRTSLGVITQAQAKCICDDVNSTLLRFDRSQRCLENRDCNSDQYCAGNRCVYY